MDIVLTQIGTISTPFNQLNNMPVQPVGANGIVGIAELSPEFAEGLTDLDEFSHVTLLYHLHRVSDYKLKVVPFMDNCEHGVFATRSPKRPSPIGMSIVRVMEIQGNKLFFEGADMLNSSPLIDIKPFFRQADNRPDAVSGWMDKNDDTIAMTTKSDCRFI